MEQVRVNGAFEADGNRVVELMKAFFMSEGRK